MNNSEHSNALYLGDNLEVLDNIPDGSIDLIYLDPPFNSKRDYNIIFKSETGIPIDQLTAFKDTWVYTAEIKTMVDEFMVAMNQGRYSAGLEQLMKVWVKVLEETDPEMLAYLVMMVQRLDKLKTKLKETGSLYLHCDPNASHYIKVAMDGVFGRKNFVNEIVRGYKTGGVSKKHWARKHDTILMYSKEQKQWFFKYQTYKSYQKYKYGFGSKHGYELVYDDEKNQYYKNAVCRDIWEDIPAIGTVSTKRDTRLGYPTQKPIALLERIIQASCPPGGVVLDPFCGCGTTIEAAHKLDRGWIGIDVCKYAVDKIMERMHKGYNLQKSKDYQIYNYPFVIDHIEPLLQQKQGRYIFQDWAIEHVKGISNKTKSGDRGVDGALYFYTSMENSNLGKMVISVKSDKKLQAQYIRDLIGTMSNQEAQMAGLISLAEPTEGMKLEAAQAGKLEIDMGVWGEKSYDKVQLLTVRELFEGKRFDTPPTRKLG